MNDLISRQAAIDAFWQLDIEIRPSAIDAITKMLMNLPSAQPERLPADDIETIRIHLNACKEKLCNQQRWAEAEEYQNIIDRFMAFASAQQKHGKWRWINKGWIWIIDDGSED